MLFQTVVPILYSRDIDASLAYYTGVLGFDGKWRWGDPPSFAGIIKDSVEIFFCKEGQGTPGMWLAIMVGDIDEYYETVKRNGAKIPWGGPQTMEHGVREFCVEDPDGHIIRFGQNIPASTSTPGGPLAVRIVESQPANPAVVYSIAAEHPETHEQLGAAHLLGDNNGFFYVKDVFVQPQWRGHGIATQLMRALTAWLDANAPEKASVWLHTAENLTPFYKKFGFIPVPGMARFFNPPG